MPLFKPLTTLCRGTKKTHLHTIIFVLGNRLAGEFKRKVMSKDFTKGLEKRWEKKNQQLNKDRRESFAFCIILFNSNTVP